VVDIRSKSKEKMQGRKREHELTWEKNGEGEKGERRQKETAWP
jgi:hypothetical protein